MSGIDLRKLAKAVGDADTVLTPQVIRWLLRYGDDALPGHVVQRVAELLGTQPRDRSGSFSGSSSGTCLRAQELGYLGMPQAPTDAQLRNIYNDGKWRHLRWQSMLLAMGAIAVAEYSVAWGGMRAVGTLDGLGTVPDDHPRGVWRGQEFGFELKGISTFQFQKVKDNGPLEHHVQQVHRYFLIAGLPLFVFVYEDKTTQAWCEWVVEPNEKLLAESQAELKELNAAIDRKKLHPLLKVCEGKSSSTWHTCAYGGKTLVCPKAGTWPGRKKQ
jgi:hypothetical protein